MKLQKYLYNCLNAKLYNENSNKDRIKIYPHSSSGKVVYSPTVKDVCDSSWVILQCEEEIVNYYKWFLSKKGVVLDSLMWGSHISVIRGGTWDEISPQYADKWKFNDGEYIEYQYGDLVTNGVHWWLEVSSEQLEAMRQALGLKAHPGFGFHVTIGKIREYK